MSDDTTSTTEPDPSGKPAGETAPPTTEPTGESGTDLGEGGRKALDEERKARREAERQFRDASARLHDLETAELRREVSAEKNLTPGQAKFLTGSTREELAASAAELLEAFETPKPAVHRKPTEALKGGIDPDGDGAPNVSAVADRVFDRGI